MYIRIKPVTTLDKVTEGQRLDGSDGFAVSRGFQEISRFWKLWCTLEINLGSGFACLFLGSFVLLLTSQNFLLALGCSDVLNTNVDSLLNDASVHKLVDTNSHGTLGNIENNSSASVVSLVWHTLVD